MSMEGAGGTGDPEQDYVLVRAQMDMYNRMRKSCFHKCVGAGPRAFRSEDLQTGEESCLDRCVFKYLRTHQLVDEQLKKMQQQNPQGPPM